MVVAALPWQEKKMRPNTYLYFVVDSDDLIRNNSLIDFLEDEEKN